MSDFNPYAPPQTNPVIDLPVSQVAPLASPWVRLGAQIIDGIVVSVVNLPLAYFCGYFGRVAENTRHGQRFMPESILWVIVGLAVYTAINWVFLQNGQTIGKKTTGIRIVKKDGSPISAASIIFRRLFPVQIVSVIPFLGMFLIFIDSLLIFRENRNTLHDDIADTKVIQLQ